MTLTRNDRHTADEADVRATIDDPDRFLRDNAGLAHFHARRAGLVPGECYEDVYADALIGLWDAARRWTPGRGATIATFAAWRIRGAIADGRRDRDPLSRSLRREGVTANPVSLDAAAADTGLTLGDLIADTVDPIADWHTAEDASCVRTRLYAAIAELPDQQRHVVAGHLGGKRMRDLAADMAVTESRVSKVHKAAVARLRTALNAA